MSSDSTQQQHPRRLGIIAFATWGMMAVAAYSFYNFGATLYRWREITAALDYYDLDLLLIAAVIADFLGTVVVGSTAITALIELLRYRRNARKFATLHYLTLMAISALGLLSSWEIESVTGVPSFDNALGTFLATVLFAMLWIFYFNLSKRVPLVFNK